MAELLNTILSLGKAKTITRTVRIDRFHGCFETELDKNYQIYVILNRELALTLDYWWS